MAERKSPAALINATHKSSTDWLGKLSMEDQAYVAEVINLIVTTGCAVKPVAFALKQELSLTASVSTIDRTLRDIINAKS